MKLIAVLKKDITFMGPVTHFVGIKFDSIRDNNNSLSIYMSQPSFIDTLVQSTNLESANSSPTPYCSGFPVDSIKTPSNQATNKTILQMRRIVGSILLISQSTRPAITTIL